MTERTLARRYELLELIGGGGMALAAAHQRLLDDEPGLRRLELD